MKKAILVSSDPRWRAVTEATLLEKGWTVASTEALEGGQLLDPAEVQAVWVDVAAAGRERVARWMASDQFPDRIPVIFAPGFEGAEGLARTLEWPEGTQAKAGSVRLRFWGVRGSIPTPGPGTFWYGGNTSCVELQTEGETLILDAGSGLRNLGEKLIQEAGGAPLNMHLLLSHTHWDHIQGFPFFRPAYQPGNRIRLIAYSAVRHNLDRIMDGQMEDEYFPVQMADMMSEIDVLHVGETFHCGPLKVHCFSTNHPGKCCGFRFDTSAGSVVYVPDNELNRSGQATHMPRETAQHLRERFVATVSGARVLIHDSQYTQAEYANRVGWGHSSVEDTVEMAGEAGVERLILFHHDPQRTDEGINQLLVMAREIVKQRGWSMRVDAAREGMEIVL